MRWLLVMICTTPFLPAQAAETVDFSLPPPEGLVVQITKSYASAPPDAGGDLSNSLRMQQSIRHAIREVKDGAVTKIERHYARSTVGGGDRKPRGTLLHGKKVRATWVDDKCTVTFTDGDAWKKADSFWLARLRPSELRAPVVSLGQGVRRVGESWEIDATGMHAALSCLEGRWTTKRATIRLVAVHGQSPRFLHGHAEAIVRLELKHGDPPASKTAVWEGTALYDLEHRIVVSCRGKGTTTYDSPKGRNDITWTANTVAVLRQDR